jgi:hypothetical protein
MVIGFYALYYLYEMEPHEDCRKAELCWEVNELLI